MEESQRCEMMSQKTYILMKLMAGVAALFVLNRTLSRQI